ncbi:MAG: V-type H(+)-translocating pyrophosphatase [Bacteroidota bacterium]
MENYLFLYFAPAIACITLCYALCKAYWISKQEVGTSEMASLAQKIAFGARSFLQVEYKVIALFVILTSALLVYLNLHEKNTHGTVWVAGSFIMGALFSALAGFIGMDIATRSNVRTAQAARKGLSPAFRLSFSGGAVMATGVVGLALLGLGLLFGLGVGRIEALSTDRLFTLLEVLTGFSLGAESIALFARVAGGIYTKAADVGADIVGKIEQAIPEDDPRNPAVIADNVGDNVGDVAGMGADLFGSYVSTILAAMVLGAEAYETENLTTLGPVLFPLAMAGLGALASIVGIACVRLRNEKGDVHNALQIGNIVALLLSTVGAYFLLQQLISEGLFLRGHEIIKMRLFYALTFGVAVGGAISWLTGYFTTAGHRPVDMIISQSLAGPATNVIAGLSVGMLSTVIPAFLFAGAIYGAFSFAGFYGVAIAAVGMMSTTAVQLAIDAFGPIADNAGGIAEMSGLPEEVRVRTDILDAVGNTTAATGKGFAIASAALTSLALFAAFVGMTGLEGINIYQADVLAGLLIGAMLPFLFSALTIQAVGTTAGKMVEEVRRQFATTPDILAGKVAPDYDRCIGIATYAALRQMFLPAACTLGTPLIVGLLGGAEVLAAFLAGVMVVGVFLALFQCNAGGAWDNAKKAFEKGITLQGKAYHKGSLPHQAAVVGDTVGDPFKDTSGPSINILIKLTAIVALLLAPFLS